MALYHSLKNIAKKIIPNKLFLSLKENIRPIVYQFYKGNNYTCNICQAKLKSFIVMHQNDKLCPNCGSLSRHRYLFQLLNTEFEINGKLLEFSPPPSLAKVFTKKLQYNYYPSDFVGEFISNYHFDITSISAEENYFDKVICFHVLEHIEEDDKAIKELYRVLKPNGIAFIQTPFKQGKTYEDKSITNPQQRKQHFGQEDHVRIYSLNDITEKLSLTGFKISICKSDDSFSHLGILSDEKIIVAEKTKG